MSQNKTTAPRWQIGLVSLTVVLGPWFCGICRAGGGYVNSLSRE